MKKGFLAALLLLPLGGSAQAPGGVSTNLKLWLKANSGITLNTGSTVAQWNELSGAGVTGNFATQPAANVGMTGTQNPPAYVPQGVNFNPHVAFSANAVNSVASNNAFVGTDLIDPYNNTLLQVIKLRTMNGTGVWFKWQYNNSNSNRLGNEVNNGGANTGKMRFDFRGVNNFSTTVIADQYYLASCNTTQAQSTIRLNGANDNVVNYGTQAAFTAPAANPARVSLGNEAYGDSYPTTIDIAEVILYNRTLTAAERNKVESYLAVKYGFTLDQSTGNPNDYTSSTGTVIWNRTANQPYLNNITGIGRDDGDSLKQRQSRSINPGAMVTIYHGSYNGGSFPQLNTGNGNNFLADQSYLLFGDNGNTTALNRCFSGNPSFLRMNRAWKVQRTGSVGVVTLAVSASAVPANTKHLLVSTDSAFTAANTTYYRLDSVNGILSKAVPLLNGSYFTFASDTLLLKPSSNSPLCVGSTIQLRANLPNATYSWTGPQGFTSTQQNPAIANADVVNSGTYTVNASVNGCPFAPATVNVTVSTKPAPPTVATPVVYCTGDVAAPLTASGSGLAWYTLPSGGALPGSTTPPVPSTAQAGTFVWWVVQSNDGCESIRAKQEVIVRERPNGIITSPRSNICQGDVDSFYYYGNADASLEYNWKAPIGQTTFLGGSGQGPVIYQFDSAGPITVRMQVNNGGCVSKDAFFTVTVRPRPVTNAVMLPDVCVGQLVDIALDAATTGISNITWDFADGEIRYGSTSSGPYGIEWATPGLKEVRHTSFAAGCPSFTTIDTVVVHPAPAVRITQNLPGRVCEGDSILFVAGAEDTSGRFIWTPARFFPDSAGARAWGRVEHSGYVGVALTDSFGCTGRDSLLVATQPCCGVYLPNAFTPNNDGTNDLFRIVTAGNHAVYNFRIVNRWGQVVFETTNESTGWDGTYKGEPQDPGTYHYFLRYRCTEGQDHTVEQKGDLILLR